MQIDQAGIDLIRGFEGCKLEVYLDIAGIPTIGVGHAIRPPESAADYAGGIDQDQANGLLQRDLEPVERGVNSIIPPSCTQNQYNALCSFAFNLGVSNMRVMISHGWDQIPAQMLRWDNAAGKPSAGLEARRKAESELFTS